MSPDGLVLAQNIFAFPPGAKRYEETDGYEAGRAYGRHFQNHQYVLEQADAAQEQEHERSPNQACQERTSGRMR
jgi:hypothetical protein